MPPLPAPGVVSSSRGIPVVVSGGVFVVVEHSGARRRLGAHFQRRRQDTVPSSPNCVSIAFAHGVGAGVGASVVVMPPLPAPGVVSYSRGIPVVIAGEGDVVMPPLPAPGVVSSSRGIPVVVSGGVFVVVEHSGARRRLGAHFQRRRQDTVPSSPNCVSILFAHGVGVGVDASVVVIPPLPAPGVVSSPRGIPVVLAGEGDVV